MSICIEKLCPNLIDEVMPIIEQNHSESGQFETLNIDWEGYLCLGDAFICCIMRNNKEQIVGILFFVTGTYPHNKDWLMAHQVTFYVLPKYRNLSMKLLKFSEKYFENKVDIILQSARVYTHFCNTLERKGYEPLDVIFAKRTR